MDARQFVKRGKFVRTEDLRENGPRRLTITGVESVENKFAKGEQVLQLVCDGGTRAETRLDLRTKANQDFVLGTFGHDTDDWIGQVIEAYYSPDVQGPSGGKGGTRLRLPAAPPNVSTFVSELDDAPRRAKPNGSGAAATRPATSAEEAPLIDDDMPI